MSERLHGPEAIRGVAALVVALGHGAHLADPVAAADGVFNKGYLAVDLFFMLSGFVLARTYETRMPSAAVFFVQRYKRLWGLIAVGVMIGAIFFALIGTPLRVLLPNLIGGLAILPIIGFAIRLNVPAWSIFFELVANALHALIFARMGNAALLVLAGTSAILLLVFARDSALDVGQGDAFLLGIPRVVMSYTIGIALWRILGDRPRCSPALAVLAVIALPLAIYAAGLKDGVEADLAFALLACPIILMASLALKPSRAALFVGALSFPLYAVHYPVQAMILSTGASLSVAFAASILTGICAGIAFDKRSRAAFARCLPNPSVVASAKAARPSAR